MGSIKMKESTTLVFDADLDGESSYLALSPKGLEDIITAAIEAVKGVPRASLLDPWETGVRGGAGAAVSFHSMKGLRICIETFLVQKHVAGEIHFCSDLWGDNPGAPQQLFQLIVKTLKPRRIKVRMIDRGPKSDLIRVIEQERGCPQTVRSLS